MCVQLLLTGVCGPADPKAWTEGSGYWLWHRRRRLLHGKGRTKNYWIVIGETRNDDRGMLSCLD